MINKLISIGNFKVVLSVLILFLSTAIYPMDEKQESVNRVMSLIKETNARIEKDAQEIKKIENLDSIYIFLGLTGAGKSTIINFLANNKMMVRSNLGFRAIYVVDHTIEGIEIGNDVTSETKYPAYWYDQEKGIIYYDTPGLTDTGSSEITRAEAEIVNAYSIFKLFEILPRDKIKIVLVMTEGSINGRGAGMRDTIAIMGSYFKNHLKEVAQGTCIIVTKQNELTEPNQVLEVFRSVFANGRGTFTKESLLFLENLVSESKIVFFPKPAEGEISKELDGRKWSGVKESIAKALFETKKLNQNITPAIGVSDKTAKEYYISGLSTKENSKIIKGLIATECFEEIKKHCQDKIIGCKTNPQELRRYFTELSDQLEKLDVEDVNRFIQGVHNVLVEKCNRVDLYDKIKYQIDVMMFFKQLNQDIVFRLDEWSDAFSNTRKYLEELGENPEYVTPSDDVLQIIGLLVGASDIPSPNNLSNYLGRKNIKRVDLYGLNTLWLDADITSHRTKGKNGFSFSFVAPNWRIAQKVTIDLSGEDGSAGDNGIDGDKPGAHGSNGAPGEPGGNGGHFYGKGIDFGSIDQLRLLTIKTSGGRGGDGGNGGNGADGLIGEDGDLANVRITDEETSCCNEKYHYNDDKGQSGSNGGNAGQGGAKGIGGYAGSAIIYGATADWYSFAGNSNGNNGKAGTAGKMGAHGKDCEGRWHYHNNYNGHVFARQEVGIRHIPSTKPYLSDGQPATSFNSLGIDSPITQEEEPNRDNKLVEDYIEKCGFYSNKYEGNPLINCGLIK